MGVLGARPGDITACLFAGNHDACQRVLIGYYLWPKLQEALERLEILEREVPIRVPRPDPPPFAAMNEFIAVSLAPMLGDPNPQPSIPPEIRLKATVTFRDGLRGVAATLDEEVKALEKIVQHGKRG